jgi:Zn-dependent M28 family amino/carboxypeptidase
VRASIAHCSLFVLGLAALHAHADEQRWLAHVRYLSDDALEGRNTGSDGHRMAAEYVARHFEEAGLAPAGSEGFFQPIVFRTRKVVEKKSSLALVRNGTAVPLELGEDATISMRVEPAPSVEAGLVFVGYGLTIPELGIDDLAGQDLRGKLAVFVTGGPASVPGPLLAHFQSAGERWSFLKQAGAIGTLQIQNPRGQDIPWERSKLSRLQPAMEPDHAGLVDTRGQKLALTLNPARAEKFFQASGRSFAELLQLAVERKPLPSFPLGVSLKAKVAFDTTLVTSHNVAGILPGSDPVLGREVVVLSAHLDHVGIGEPIAGDRIYNGAMDNASGIATLLDVAAALRESRAAPRRSLLLQAVTGEEKGLAGSRYYAAFPTVKPDSMVANINTDMFLPLFPLKHLIVHGLDESDLGAVIKEVAWSLGIEAVNDPEPERNAFIRSDQYSFIRKGVPALSMKVGYLKDSPEAKVAREWRAKHYHAPSDEASQPVNLQAVADFDKVMARLALAIANRNERPRWKSDSFFRRFAAPDKP